MAKLKNYTPVLYFLAIFVVVYFFFLNWEAKTAYGDDLTNFKSHATAKTFIEQVNIPNTYGKYRPVNGVVFNVIIDWFGKDLHAYYVFNVGMVAVCTFLLFLTLNLILESYFFAFLFSLAFGLSRFFYYAISQLTMGGALEGLALAFFIGSLFFIVRALTRQEPPQKKQTDILLSILCANLSMYTHERYVVIFVFLLVVIFIFPSLRNLSMKQKAVLGSVTVGSLALNVVIKKFVYGMPFFVGTGGTNIEFSSSQAMTFLYEGVLSIFQINTGPDYLVGTSFSSLPGLEKMMGLIVVISFIIGFGLLLYTASLSLFRYYASKVIDNSLLKEIPKNQYLNLFFFLFAYFFLCLAPAIVTIRIEQRWLIASLSIFIVMLAILLASIKYKSVVVKYVVYSIIPLCFMWINFTYLKLGITNIYMYNSERIAAKFKDAMDKDIIHKSTTTIYLWEKKKDINIENDVNWTLYGGYIFEYYGSSSKQLLFVDSIYTKTDTSYTTSFPGFDAKTTQIVQLIPELKDITNEYLKDSLKSFITTQ